MTGSAAKAPDFLARMATASQARFSAAAALESAGSLRTRAEQAAAAPPLQLSPAGFDLVAEIKRRSPSAGQLAREGLEPVAQAEAYAAAGAAALSVLTEPEQFDGNLGHLTAVAAAERRVPAMRKDFLVHPYQVIEARAAGAGGVLLIAAMLDRPVLTDMLQTALELGLFALVEVFDAADLAHCLPVMTAAGPAIDSGRVRMLVGVNCRDLRSLQVDFARFAELAPQLPEDLPRVAESGVELPEQAAEVARLGYDLALVGTALMRAGNPRDTAQALLAAGRAARA